MEESGIIRSDRAAGDAQKTAPRESGRFIITATGDQSGRHEYWVWEYDPTRPRAPDAEDPRMRYACKGLAGVYRTRALAESAILTEGNRCGLGLGR